MANDEYTAVECIRALSGSPNAEAAVDWIVALQERAEWYLFQDARIGCGASIVEGALEAVGTQVSVPDVNDEELAELWLVTVDRCHGQFLDGSLGSTQQDPTVFFEGCARVFGVESKQAPALLCAFHELELRKRLAILLCIAESPSFDYLNPLIDSYKGVVDIAPRVPSMRELIRMTLAGS